MAIFWPNILMNLGPCLVVLMHLLVYFPGLFWKWISVDLGWIWRCVMWRNAEENDPQILAIFSFSKVPQKPLFGSKNKIWVTDSDKWNDYSSSNDCLTWNSHDFERMLKGNHIRRKVEEPKIYMWLHESSSICSGSRTPPPPPLLQTLIRIFHREISV